MNNRHGTLIVSMNVLAVYTSFIVGVAEGTPLPYLLTLPVAGLSLFLSSGTNRRLFKPISSAVAFALGLVAFALALAELSAGNIEARLTSGAHLLVYLTWIVLLMRKRLAEYWWLAAMCVVQVGIGAVFMNDPLYGVFLAGFVVLIVWAMSVFSLHRLQALLSDSAAKSETSSNAEARDPGQEQAVTGPQPVAHQSLLSTSRVLPGAGAGTETGWFSLRFLLGIFGMGMASAVIATVFFLLVPRVWIGKRAWGNTDLSKVGQTETGFSESVSLGSFGQMLESNETVLEVTVFDASGNSISVEGFAAQLGQAEPLFRGHILDTYENGQWSLAESRRRLSHRVPTKPPQQSFRQVYRFRPIGTDILFSMRSSLSQPVDAVRFEEQNGRKTFALRVSHGDVLIADHDLSRQQFVIYEVYTRSGGPSFRSNQDFVSPIYQAINDGKLQGQLQAILRQDVGLKPRAIPSPANPNGPQVFYAQEKRRMNQIVQYLRNSGEFRYSLNIPRRQMEDVDPVIEFLTRTRAGHCQYFATALALLLRADNIPSRVVGGFKGGELNGLTGYFEVQQRHAHAWVEAYVGEWTTVDATPAAARDEAVERVGGLMQPWRRFQTYLKHLWSNYVNDFDFEYQQRKVYQPLKSTAGDAWSAVSQERKSTAAGMRALVEFLKNPSRWFSWQGGLLASCVLLFVASMVWAARRITAAVRSLRKSQSAVAGRSVIVEFYERFRRLCESIGIVRAPSQTQREFADEVARKFNADYAAAGAMQFPMELTAQFYRVRFGERELSEQELSGIDRRLTELETAIHNQQANETNGRNTNGKKP